MGILLGFSFLLSIPAEAQVHRWVQPDSLPPIRTVYNVGPNEFIVGGRIEFVRGDSLNEIWRFARKLGISDWIWESGMYVEGHADDSTRLKQFHQLADMADSGERIFTAHPLLWSIGGLGFAEQGQMLEAYAFDSTQSPYVEWKFHDLQGKGTLRQNSFYRPDLGGTDWPWRDYYTTERLYSSPTDVGLILQHLAIRTRNEEAYTDWKEFTSREYRGNNDFFQYTYGAFPNAPEFMKLWVALKGHMIEPLDPNVQPEDTIFIIHLTHVIPKGKTYLDDRERIVKADRWTEILIDSFAVTKAQLTADLPNVPASKYRDVSDSTDLRYRFNNPALRGPYYRSSDGTVLSPTFGDDNGISSQIFDVKVFWTGKERAAIRSIMLRNRTAELMYGSSQMSLDFRQTVLDTARRVVYGVDSNGLLRSTDSIRRSLFRIESGHEAGFFGFGTFRALQRFIADSINSGNDSVAVGMVEHNPGMMHHSHTMGNLDAVHIEYNYYDGYRPVTMAQSPPFPRLPALREHNGGRNDKLIGPPELGLTPDSIELYSFMMQRFRQGYYADTLLYPRAEDRHNVYTLQELAHAAQISRDFGVPLYGVPGLVSYMSYDTNGLEWVRVYDPETGTDVDSLTAKNNRSRIGHLHEVSELRMADNLLLCYGGRGLLYHWLTTYFNMLGSSYRNVRIFPKGINGPDTILWGEKIDINIIGDSLRPYIEDRTSDVIDVVVYNRGFWTGRDNPTWKKDTFFIERIFTDTIPGVYLGWKSRPDGLAEINRRTKELGSEMIRRGIRWRTSYSLHNQAAMPGTADTKSTFTTRPLPPDEIVTAVRAWNPISGVTDSAWNTYVELGLFYTIPNRLTGPVDDTNYVFVLNRRTFERPPDVSDTTARGRLMDSLTETRVIQLRFNLPSPKTTEHSFIRVREVLPDRVNLPLLGRRHTLDTIIYSVDSGVNLLLGPGYGALLEITYVRSAESMREDRFGWDTQRTFHFSTDRWHYCFLNNGSISDHSSTEATASIGLIRRESPEPVVSIGPTIGVWLFRMIQG